jgi:hypothetical protein
LGQLTYIMSFAEITEPAITVSVNTTYTLVKNSKELYDYTRGIWRVDKKRAENAEYALAVYKGKIVEVFEISSWHPAKTTEYKSNRDFLGTDPKGRSEFIGRVAKDEIREKYVGKFVARGYGAPVRYYNC